MSKFAKLSRVEMKNVMGGVEDACPKDECGDSNPCPKKTQTCDTVNCMSGNGTYKICGGQS